MARVRFWCITDETGGSPGVFLGARERYQDALHSISMSWSKRHVRIEKDEFSPMVAKVRVEVFEGDAAEPSEVHLYRVQEEPILEVADHL